MELVTFNPHALRVRQARLSAWLGRWLRLLRTLALLLSVGGGVVIVAGSAAGYLILAPAVPLVMLLLWYRWELQNLPAQAIPAAKLKLEDTLAAEVAARLSWPAAPAAIYQAIQSLWQTEFLSLRLGFHPDTFKHLSDNVAEAEAVWTAAAAYARQLSRPGIGSGAILMALVKSLPAHQEYLAQLNLKEEDLVEGLFWLEHLEDVMQKSQQKQRFGGLARDWAAGYTPLLNRFGLSLSAEIERGAYYRQIGSHQQIITQVVNLLAQSYSNSAALVGETGTGKTTIAYGIAQRLLEDSAPASIRYHQVISLDASVLVAQAPRFGGLENLVLHLLTEAVHSTNTILFLDEAQAFFGNQSGTVDISNILLPVVQSGRVRLILAMSPQAWQQLGSTNQALATALQYQAVTELPEREVLQVLQDQALLLERKTHTVITYQAIKEAYRLSQRYITEAALPGKAIKVLDGTASNNPGALITSEVVQAHLEATLGVKVTAAGAKERDQLLHLEDELHKRLINQSRAVKVVADALRRARAGVGNPNRPVGSFLFLGPTGVGKTELSKALAEVYFGGRDQIIQLDMTEYTNSQDVARLLSPVTAENRGSLLSLVRRNPFSVVLLDEIEKAHPDILNLLLQLLEEGRLTDTTGRKVSFKDSIIIVTSNAGAEDIRSRIERGQALEEFEDEFTNQLVSKHQFRPELLNRFDEIVLFRPLKKPELLQIVALLVEELNQTLSNQQIKLTLSSAAAEWIVEHGYDARLGARPMRRMMQRTVENYVAKQLLAGSLQPGGSLELDVADLEKANRS